MARCFGGIDWDCRSARLVGDKGRRTGCAISMCGKGGGRLIEFKKKKRQGGKAEILEQPKD